MKEKVVILGAGIQGISCALALQSKGHEVVLIDKCTQLFNRASYRNEGKIHLGFVYANDDSFQTAALMLESALLFGPLLQDWVKTKIEWEKLVSHTFSYVVHKESMLPLDDILHHYYKLQNYYEEYRTPYHHYLGELPDRLWYDGSKSNQFLNPESVSCTIPTVERALNLGKLKPLLLDNLVTEKIKTRINRTVTSVQRTTYGFRVEGLTADGHPWSEEGGIVINCLWDNRLHIDSTMGITPERQKWIYRLKYRILGQLPPQLSPMESYTFVLGPFGDIVTYPEGDTYLSWYPSCMRGWSEDVTPPLHWENACKGVVEDIEKIAWSQEALSGLNTFFPGIDQFKINHIDAGTIFSWGETDIDDHGSELHRRYKIGVNDFDGYYSIDTGKFTSAPMFAHQLLQKI